MDWTDETIARLRELWSQGLSTAEIGRQLSITKNAVVGKAHRLGLPPRPSPIRNRKVKDGEAATEAAPRRKSPSRAKTAPASEHTTPDLLADKPAATSGVSAVAADAAPAAPRKAAVAVKAAPAKASAPPVRPAPAPAVKVVAEKRADPVVAPPLRDIPDTVSRSAPRATPAPRSPSTTAQRFTAGIDRPARRGPSCCWPIGDPGTPGFHFCGATPLPGKPYCAEHAAIAYVKIRDRRD
ncbi:GcrA family cell cycle regulator [Gluconobacter morbifer]|nr:GcrA family cell cycle regulator [Gluconobacter morbifer]